MIVTKLRRSTFRHIEDELEAYHETRREIVRLKDELLYGSGVDENVGGGRSNLPGDPTGRIAVKLTTHKQLEQMINITSAIESVVESLPRGKRRMVELRYWTKPQTLTWDGIAKAIPAHRATAIRWRDIIIRAIATRAGWR